MWQFNFKNKKEQIREIKEFLNCCRDTKLNDNTLLWIDEIEDQISGIYGEVNNKKTNCIWNSLVDGLSGNELKKIMLEIPNMHWEEGFNNGKAPLSDWVTWYIK